MLQESKTHANKAYQAGIGWVVSRDITGLLAPSANVLCSVPMLYFFRFDFDHEIRSIHTFGVLILGRILGQICSIRNPKDAGTAGYFQEFDPAFSGPDRTKMAWRRDAKM